MTSGKTAWGAMCSAAAPASRLSTPAAISHDYESLLASAENLRQEYDRLLTWADLFDTCSFEAKKMIVAQFVKAIRVSRDYNIEIDFNVSFEEFQNFSVKNGEPVILQPLRSHTA